jgi:hypothetical protein
MMESVNERMWAQKAGEVLKGFKAEENESVNEVRADVESQNIQIRSADIRFPD